MEDARLTQFLRHSRTRCVLPTCEQKRPGAWYARCKRVSEVMSGIVVWFTGLPSSGKSRLAARVQAEFERTGRACCVLDGDRIRALLRPEPGYSPAERDDFYTTLSGLAAELARQGLVVLVPATAHLRKYRRQARELAPRFLEVWLNANVEECRRRDAKGLYAGFAAGKVRDLPGEDVSFESPDAPEVEATGGHDAAALDAIVRLVTAAN